MQLNIEEESQYFREICCKHSLKITPQREVIYREFKRLKNEHPSAEMVYRFVKKEYPHISFDTVNRTLLKFAEIGIADILKGVSGSRRFDPVGDQHHHFQCDKCSAIFDFLDPQYDNLEIPESLKKKFNVTQKKVFLSGLCPKCYQKT